MDQPCGDCKTKWFTLFLPTLLWIIYINSIIIIFAGCVFFLTKNLGSKESHMSFHENALVNFVIFNQLFVQNKYLGQNINYYYFQFANNRLQHLWMFKIHKEIIIRNKKNPNKLNFDYVISKIQIELVQLQIVILHFPISC
jgi:uncharacterized membrane protein YozB (DUF420 family)